MTDALEMIVAAMPHADVSEDAALIQLEFSDSNGKSIKLSFDSEQFEKFSNRAMQLFTHARNQKMVSGDHLTIHAMEVIAATAEPAAGGSKVILALKGDKGQIYHFSLTPECAEGLRAPLYRAAKSAKKQASAPRH